MKLNPVFQTASVPIPDRSGFDLTKEHLFTAPVGTVVPAEVIEVLPNDTFSMGSMMKVTLPPFAVPFMGRIDACLESFFVPSRILWKGWQSFITQNNGSQQSSGVPVLVPVVDPYASANAGYVGPGTLLDYLGCATDARTQAPTISALPLLAYHKIMDHWYRDQNNVKPFFYKNPATYQPTEVSYLAHLIDSVSGSFDSVVLPLAPTSSTDSFAFDITLGLGDLRQRSWAKDYFTTMTTRPQAGDAAQITFSTSGATGSITVSDIRVANALQRWLERNNLAGTDYGSQILAHFGVTPPDAVLDKPLLLGQVRESVYVGSVENNSNAQAESTNNPFGQALGSAAGFGSGFGKGSLIPEFHAKEHGYIMVMFSLVPHAYYDTGIDRQLVHKSIGDFGWPEYAKVGDQAVYELELVNDGAVGTVMGYNQRYSEYKMRLDKISGKLHGTEDLSVYALKRGFGVVPALGKQFLEIPKNYLDQVSQVNYEVSKFGCMVDCFFDTRSIRLLPSYSLPSL